MAATAWGRSSSLIITSRFLALAPLREDVPEAVNTIFKKMVAKKVGDRYQTMTEVVTDLQACGVGNEQLSIMQQSIVATDENSALTFLRSIPAARRTGPSRQSK